MFGVKLYKQSKDCPWIAELLLKLKIWTYKRR